MHFSILKRMFNESSTTQIASFLVFLSLVLQIPEVQAVIPASLLVYTAALVAVGKFLRKYLVFVQDVRNTDTPTGEMVDANTDIS